MYTILIFDLLTLINHCQLKIIYLRQKYLGFSITSKPIFTVKFNNKLYNNID